MGDEEGRFPVVEWSILAAQASALRQQYQAAQPWPHLVLHDLFPAALLDAAVEELRGLDRSRMSTASTRTMVKRETADDRLLGPATRRALAALHDPEFHSFVGAITGIDDLQGDTERFWAGVHETGPGGFTMVHTDFQIHPTSRLHHRTNALLYLNRDWRPSWGGSLELWPPDMSALGRRVEPLFNTLVLFETTGRTYHGLPQPVACPAGMTRLSLAAYQYSATPPAASAARLSKYAARPGDDWRVGLPTWWDLKSRLPNSVRRVGGGVRRRLRPGPKPS